MGQQDVGSFNHHCRSLEPRRVPRSMPMRSALINIISGDLARQLNTFKEIEAQEREPGSGKSRCFSWCMNTCIPILNTVPFVP